MRVDDEQQTLEEVADELYGLVPDEFIPAREDHVRAARAAGDRAFAKDVTGLRKPSTAAWVVNLLVRRATDQLVGLLDLGESLRTAQAALAGDQLKELGRQRAQVVSAIAREGRRLAREAGHPVSPAIEEEVAETLRAALADPVAAQAVRSGRLTSSLSYAGLGELDVSGVVALAPRRAARQARAEDDEPERPARAARTRVRAVPDEPAGEDDADRRAREREERRREEEERRREQERRRAEELAQARTAVAEAEDALDTARVTERLAQDAFDEAREAADRAQAKVAELEETLRRAQDAAGEATAAVRPRRREHETARHGVDVATRALDRARAHLDRLEG